MSHFAEIPAAMPHPEPLWWEALSEALFLDAPFAATRHDGPTAPTLSAWAGFWEAEERGALLAQAAAPSSWQEIGGMLAWLASHGPPQGKLSEWSAIAAAAESLAGEDPLAGCLVALQAIAAWEGGRGAGIYEMRLGQPPDPGWGVFPLAVCRCLRAAGAEWAARRLARTARDRIGSASYAYHEPHIRAMVERYNELLRAIEQRFAECERALARELHNGCRASEPSCRPELAALLWTLGDVAHAHALAATGEPPALRVIEDAVRLSIQRVRRDTFTQYVWLQMKDRPPLDLRAHELLFAAINAFYADSPMHQLEASAGQAVVSPSATYARALIAHFRGGSSDEQRSDLAIATEVLKLTDPGVAVVARWHALRALVGPAQDEDRRQERWRDYASAAITSARNQRRVADHDPYDRSLDVPLHHLSVESLEERLGAIELLERYRAACLTMWLRQSRPLQLPSDAAVAAALEREAALLAELPGLRYVRLLAELPIAFGRVDMDMEVAIDPAKGRQLLDGRRAGERLIELDGELQALYAAMSTSVPAYAARRADPTAGIDTFRGYLEPGLP